MAAEGERLACYYLGEPIVRVEPGLSRFRTRTSYPIYDRGLTLEWADDPRLLLESVFRRDAEEILEQLLEKMG